MPQFSFKFVYGSCWTFNFEVKFHLRRSNEEVDDPNDATNLDYDTDTTNEFEEQDIPPSPLSKAIDQDARSVEDDASASARLTGAGVTNSINEENPVSSPADLNRTDAENSKFQDEVMIPGPGSSSFHRLPAEIRGLIYEEILVMRGLIQDVHKLIGTKEAIMECERPRILYLYCDILRTCRTVYDEALPVLYGRNAFAFKTLRSLQHFAHGGLPKQLRSPRFAFRNSKYGRLSLMRRVYLDIGSARMPVHSRVYRKSIWSEWYNFFDLDSDHKTPGFPSLTALTLDFNEWRLGPLDTDAVSSKVINAIVQKLSQSGGLKALGVVGMRQEQNLYDLKQGLLATGGRFSVYDVINGEVFEVTQQLSERLR